MRFITLLFLMLLTIQGFSQLNLPVTFENDTLDYDLADFGGNASSIVVDPTDPNNMVAQSVKLESAALFAGTTIGTNGFDDPIPFSVHATRIQVRVWSPDANTPVRIKVEDSNDPGISVETEDTTTVAMGWETLTFDFTNQVDGTAAINFDNTYNKLSIFFNFGTDGATAGEKTYFWDDVEFLPPPTDLIDLPVTFEEDTINYDLSDFAGAFSSIVIDPTDPNNTVAQTIKTDMAATFAGTTMGVNGFANSIPFVGNATEMSVRVWSPDVDVPVRLKVENASNPAISVETELLTTVAMAWDTLVFDFSNEAMGSAPLNLNNTYSKATIFFNFGTDGATAGTKTYYWDDVAFIPPTGAQIDLPVTFESDTIDYDLVDFAGNASVIVEDPTDPANTVVQSTKTDMAATFAGTTMGDNGFANAIPFASDATQMSVRVWSPDAGTPVRLKVEDSNDAAISVETEATTAVAMAWDTLVFDFSNEAMGTAPLNVLNTYNKASIFFNFGTDGATAGEKTYFWDDVQFIPSTDTSMTSDFCETEVQHLGIPAETASAIFLTIANISDTSMIVEIESANADPVDLLLVANGSGAMISDEDFSVPGKISRTLTWAAPPADVVLNVLWSKESFAGNWQLSPMEITVPFAAPCPPPGLDQIDLPVTFEDDNVDYGLADFAGAASSIVEDPTDPTNTVAQTIKTDMADIFAGTTMGPDGFASVIPFAGNATEMSVRVWSPDAGIPVRLKVEDSNDAAISVETETLTTVAMEWDTLFFDFSNEVMGTAAINFDNTYDKATIFFNFGTDGATAGAKTYFWDDVQFVPPSGDQIDLPVTFEDDNVDYDLVDFAGNASEIVEDPTDPTNTVVQSTKTDMAEIFAGTTMGNNGFANPVPFANDATQMSVRVWSPDANIPVRLKVEDASNASISVETEAMTTVAMAWDTLTFDFSNEVMGTAALNLNNTYDKASIFFNFGTDGATAGEKTYFWDDVQFIPSTDTSMTSDFCETEVQHLGLPAETASAIFLTIANISDTSMIVEIESANADPVDFLLIANGSGAMISDEDFSVPGKISRTLTWATSPADVTLNVLWSKESFAGNWQLSPMDITVPFAAPCPPPGLDQIDLPVTFEDDNVDYDLTDFAGTASEIVEDPTDPTNTVAQTIKTDMAATFAGTTMGNNGFANPIPFTGNATEMSVRVWSPDAGIPVRLKVEDSNDPTISVETEVLTTVAMEWDTLVFDFTNEAMGTAPINLNSTYDKATIFFNFGTDGATAGAKTYFWDDVQFVPPSGDQIDLPVTFEDDNVDYDLTDFAGNASEIVEDPTDPTNTVAQSTKTDMAATFAGTTMGNNGFANPIPFTANATTMTVRVWSPDAGTPVRLKVEDANDAAISVETEVNTTVAMEWDTLVFDFSEEVMGTAPLNLDNTYSKASIFFNFGTDGATAGEKTYFWDDVQFTTPTNVQIDLPVTFEDDNVNYDLTDFAGNASEIVEDPTDPTNTVAQSTKTDMADTFAGTTMGNDGFANVIPFAANATQMSVRVWSPDAGTPVRLKVEDANDAAISVETEDTTTVAMAWDTLVFDFSNEAMGTAPLNLDNTYSKATIFFNFGTDGATAGEKTYFWDDVQFLLPMFEQIDLPVTFEDDNVDYDLTDFAGNASTIVVDPTDPANTVAQSIKTDMAATFAGTTMGNDGFANPIPFTDTTTKMTVRVWSPDAGIPVRLKVEDANDPTISVETEATTTLAEEWETLEFDFANEAMGTAPLNLDNTYDKASIFFNFGTDGATAGEKTYFWDDVQFGGLSIPLTVFDIIEASTAHDTLETAILAAELDDDLEGEGPFTVFAPTDDAFADLPAGVLDDLLNDPTGELAQVLLYHVAGVEAFSDDLMDGQFITTLQGNDVSVTIDGNNNIFINDAQVIIADLEAENGVVHVINKVLLIPVGTSGINDLKNHVTIFPNPAVGFITIDLGSIQLEDTEMTLFTSDGRTIKHQQLNESLNNVSVADLSNGVYWVRIKNGKQILYKKLVIQQ